MSLPIFLHSGMQGAPILRSDTWLDVLTSCLTTGFNANSVSSASCASGVVTLNFASDPGFSVKDTIKITGASNAVFNGNFRVVFAGGNQVTFSVPGAPDGVVAGTLSCKFAPLGWSLAFSGVSKAVFKSLDVSSSQCCIRFSDNEYSILFFAGYASMSDVDTGVDIFPAAGNRSLYLGYLQENDWALIGTSKFFYLFVENSVYRGSLVFGDINSYVVNDSDACIISDNYSSPFIYSKFCNFIKKSITGAVGQAVSYEALNTNLPPFNDLLTENLVFKKDVLCIENNGSTYSVRGKYPGAVEVYASAGSTTPFTTIFENVVGFTGRVFLARIYGDGLIGLAIDSDWDSL